MAEQITTYQCPACVGPLQYSAATGKLECEYCGSSFEVAEVEAFYAGKAAAAAPKLTCPACKAELNCEGISGEATCPGCGAEFQMEDLRTYAAQMAEKQEDNMNWDAQAGGTWQEGETDGLRIYGCKQCGGEIVTDETTGATHCPYCGNPVVLTGHFAGLPKVFKDQNHIEEVKGLYVPVWLFDTDADANVEYEATRVHRWSDSDYEYTETRHYAVIRGGGIGFENVPVDGSKKMDDTLMESIEPFDISDAVPFQTSYLPGYMADKYDVDAGESIERANERIKKSTEDAFRSTVMGYTTVTAVDSNIRLQNGKARYALYPVWILSTDWNGQKFTFAINGQTGKIAGDLPMDKGAFWKYLIGVTGAVTALAFAISYVAWL